MYFTACQEGPVHERSLKSHHGLPTTEADSRQPTRCAHKALPIATLRLRLPQLLVERIMYFEEFRYASELYCGCGNVQA